MKSMQVKFRKRSVLIKATLMLSLFVLSQVALAEQTCADATGIKYVLQSLYCSFAAIARLIGGAAYLGGVAFGVAAAFKLKQHRDNPNQVTIGVPIAYLTIAVGLVYMPSFLMEGRATIFGTDNVSSSYIGVDQDKISNDPWSTTPAPSS